MVIGRNTKLGRADGHIPEQARWDRWMDGTTLRVTTTDIKNQK